MRCKHLGVWRCICLSTEDICRVCRSEGTPEKPLYHPCVCTGSIKFIHQECLVQWLKHSRKEYCELCKHRFAFTPRTIYWRIVCRVVSS
uniref:E3 ubiquitin-protein ligase MARCHF6 n=1 Tax=Suricata suricatta TaxID=37032 RepID=A0A673TA24_SURSU